MMRWLQGLVYRYPAWITSGVGLLTLVLGYFLRDLRIDGEVTRMMPAGASGVEVLRVVERAVGRTRGLVLLAMVTTAAGFAANLAMRVVAIRIFALFAVVGIAVSFVLAVIFCRHC